MPEYDFSPNFKITACKRMAHMIKINLVNGMPELPDPECPMISRFKDLSEYAHTINNLDRAQGKHSHTRTGVKIMKAEAYKLGDIQSGNWEWAVGYPDRMGRGRFICVAVINLHGTWRESLDAETVAKLFATALNEPHKK